MSKHKTAWLNEETGEIMSPKGRFVWPQFLQPKANPKVADSKKKFSCVFLIPKDANIDAIKAEIQRAAEEKHGKKWKEKKLRMPLGKTADEPKLAEYAEDFPFVLKPSANEEFAPFVFGPDGKPFKGDPSDIYGGRWGIIAGAGWGYNTGSDGVGWNLNRVQLLDHDEPIGGGRVSTSSGFEAADIGGSAPGGGKPASTDDIF
jgi:hypothetical protein